MMNAREREQRRNQVLYTIGQMSNNQFKTSEVVSKLKWDFPLVNGNIQLTQVLDTLVNTHQLLRKDTVSGTNIYAFEDPINKFILRNTLSKTSTWLVEFTLQNP
jgi:hypothetical protein